MAISRDGHYLMETSHREENGVAAVRSGTTQDRQFARFLEAADQLGEHLNANFDEFFEKIVVNAPRTASVPETSQPVRGNVYHIEHAINRKLPETSIEKSQSSSLRLESSLVVRLHFAEAMMALMFNALNKTKQDSIRQHFRTLLKTREYLEVRGVPMATFRAYRDALRSMEDMLASNPQPEVMAVALSDDFAKRYGAGGNDDCLNLPRSAG
jgi:hypothetical protein